MNFKLATLTFVAFLVCSPVLANEGWSLGLGVVTSDSYPDQTPSNVFFPRVEIGSKSAMIIPDLKYQWTQWSLGSSGIGWRTQPESPIKAYAQLGFPQSSLSVGGQQGWFRYGVYAGAVFTQGTRANVGATVGPISVEHHKGFATSEDASMNSVALGGPVFLGKKIPLTVIGKLSYQRSNAAFKRQTLKLTSHLNNQSYTNVRTNFFAISQLNESITWINSITFNLSDQALQRQVSGLKPVHVNIFSLISYSF